MRSLSSNLTTQAAAEQSGWAEVYDFYLKSTITTPFGSSNVIRISNNGVNVSFFTPQADPEPSATRGNAATYSAWAAKRKTIKASSKFANDKLGIAVSNVSAEFADMLDVIDWRGCAVVIRKTSLTITTPTADDAVTIFNGRIDSARVTLEQIQFVCSSDLATFTDRLPSEDMHVNCRFKWADDMCGALRYRLENYQPKTVAASSTTTRLLATYAGYSAQAVTASSATDKISLDPVAAHTLSNGNRVRFAGTAVPGGLTEGVWYYVVSKATNDFKVSATYGGSAIDLTTNGTAVTMTSETGFNEDTGAKAYVGQSVTADSTTDKVTLTSHGLNNGERVRFAASVVPGGLTAAVWYYVVNSATNDFKVSATEGGSAIDITSNGTSVTMDSSAPFGADEINERVLAVGNSIVTTSSEQIGNEGHKVATSNSAGGTVGWRFAEDVTNPTPSVDMFAPYVDFDLGSATVVKRFVLTSPESLVADAGSVRTVSVFSSSDAVTWTLRTTSSVNYAVATFGGGDTVGITGGVSAQYWRLEFRKKDNGRFLDGVIGRVTAYTTLSGGTDLIDALANGDITTSAEETGFEGYNVKTSGSSFWKLTTTTVEEFGVSDWGVNLQGYWQIPDSQAGLANVGLKPYIQFDLGSAKRLKLWRIKNLPSVERSDIVRVIQIHSSPNSDMSGSTHEMNFEVQPVAGGWSDIYIHNASSARYWRICVRSTWAEALNFKMMAEVRAYQLGRNYWHNGRVTFAADTATVALRNISRRVLASASGAVDIVALPATPAAGDRFVIERGCGRTFNECCVRKNWTNFGGFTTLPGETVLR